MAGNQNSGRNPMYGDEKIVNIHVALPKSLVVKIDEIAEITTDNNRTELIRTTLKELVRTYGHLTK